MLGLCGSVWENLFVRFSNTCEFIAISHLNYPIQVDMLPEINIQMVEAREEHFEEVLRLSEGVYSGLDYLPTTYHTFIYQGNSLNIRIF